MEKKRVAIMGAGSIGTILGALLTRGGVQVDLIDQNEEHVTALNAKGATVVGGVELTIPVSAVTPDQIEGTYDVVFLLCKQTATEEALARLLPHLRRDSVVCTLQNGIPEPHVAEIVGKERTMGGIVLFGATWEAPGVSRCTSEPDHMANGVLLEIGEMEGGVTPRLKEVQELLSKAGKTALSENLMGLRWKKVLINATSSGMSAALGCEFGWYLDRDDMMMALTFVGDECARVVHAEGVTLAEPGEANEVWNYDTAELLPDKSNFWLNFVVFRQIWNTVARSLKASMLQDLEKGRPCEIDYINGEVIRAGQKHGIPTPYNDMIAALVKLAQARKTVWRPEEAAPFFRALLARSEIPPIPEGYRK